MVEQAPSDLFRVEWSGDALERLGQLRDARGMLDIWIEDAVKECRTNSHTVGIDDVTDGQGRTETREHTNSTAPISWQRIADALGVSKQYAWERFRYL